MPVAGGLRAGAVQEPSHVTSATPPAPPPENAIARSPDLSELSASTCRPGRPASNVLAAGSPPAPLAGTCAAVSFVPVAEAT